MKKEYLDKLRQDPIRYKKYLEKKRKYFKQILSDPIRKRKLYDKKNKEERIRWKTDSVYRKQKNEKVRKLNKISYSKKVFYRLVKAANRFYKDGKLVPFDLWKIAKKQKLVCPFTGQKLTNENISLDHIIPKSKGGLNVPSNVRLTLKDINIAKQSLSDEEFIKMCNLVSSYTSL